jgi:hypothetical protein
MSRVHLLTMNFPCLQELPPTEPLIRVTKASGTRWGNPLGVVAQPPLSKSSWRRWCASPLLLKGARSPQPLLQKKGWPQERRRALHRLLVLQKGQRPQRRKRKRPPRLDWWTLPAFSAPRP